MSIKKKLSKNILIKWIEMIMTIILNMKMNNLIINLPTINASDFLMYYVNETEKQNNINHKKKRNKIEITK